MSVEPQKPQAPSDDRRYKLIDQTMRKNGYAPQALIETLHTVQESFGYIDEKALVCDDACNGHYCIIASETGMADHDIVDTYRGLWRIAMTSAT